MEDRFKFRAVIEFDNGERKLVYYDINEGETAKQYFYNAKIIRREQCIGRKDKNGKLIFEGDVIGAIGIVVWKEKDTMFGFKPLNDDYSLTFEELEQDDEDFEIIGNITENPELITKINERDGKI